VRLAGCRSQTAIPLPVRPTWKTSCTWYKTARRHVVLLPRCQSLHWPQRAPSGPHAPELQKCQRTAVSLANVLMAPFQVRWYTKGKRLRKFMDSRPGSREYKK
jgi:hypothetical protein